MKKEYIKKEIVYAFIDGQNLNLGTSKDIYRRRDSRFKLIYKGWKLDYKRFRIFLRHKFYVKKAFLFIGYIKKNEPLYRDLKRYGYILIFKPTVCDLRGHFKGNIDADLVLHCCRIEYDNFDKAVIVSGDGDFYCLHKFLLKEDKLKSILIPNSKSESSLLKEFVGVKKYLEYEKHKLELRKK
ncbi:MAG: NYN domain-containing protein [Candidatus Dojkabacteria bacterium]|nr:NYN domain-containing protein [Candidatus Dojkabacteria bacterium]